ncbi:NAD(P)-dependent glycerol-3-phosphate dehydrogenase [Candidatus Dependentiae bacterium]|nr:NAD(P)-dependent glycerol-3-phosphate dehydrogenase [Candidatus Dependentiae bacterium]
MKVCILGEGAWGTAVATLLANNGHTVHVWCYHKEVAEDIKENRSNSRYLPNIALDKNIVPFIDIEKALCDVDWVFEAIPVQYLRSILEQAQRCFNLKQTWVVLSKGIEKGSFLLPSQVIDAVFATRVKKAIFSGPSFAKDLAEKQITGVTIAADDCETGQQLSQLLANNYFRPYISLDVIGAQIGGALKNVITLGVGMLDGAGYTDNAKAFLLSRGFHEIVTIATLLGAQCDTLYGLCGIGDLVLTAMGKHSKNLTVGRRLGKGEKLQNILEETGYIPEGVNTVQAMHQYIKKNNLDLPVCDGIYQVIFQDKKLEDMLANLMQRRPLEVECKRSL